MTIMAKNMAASRHCTGAVAESLHVIQEHEADRDREDWECCRALFQRWSHL